MAIRVLPLLASLTLASACGGDDSPEAVAQDSLTVTIGGQEQVAVLARGQVKVTVTFPADAVPTRTPVMVRLETQLTPRRGPTPAGGLAVNITTLDLRLSRPARARTALPAPPPGRSYVAVTSSMSSDEWTPTTAARRLTMVEGGMAEWEMDIGGSGLWGFGLVQVDDGAGPVDAGPTSVDASAQRPPDAGAGDLRAMVDAPPVIDTAPRQDAGAADAAPAVDVALAADAAPAVDVALAADAAPAADAAGSVDVAPVPAPNVSQVDPALGAVNMPASVTVTASGILEGAVVYLDTLALVTTRSGERTVVAQIPASALPVAGQYPLYVVNRVGAATARSNVVYFTASAITGAPVVVDYNPDNGLAGDKIQVVGRNLVGEALKIADPRGLEISAGPTGGTISWWSETLQTVEFTLPAGWTTGPITVTNSKGTYRGKVFNVGKNLATLPGAKAEASTEYGGTWTKPRGADNNLVTSWFSAIGDCVSAGPTTCKTVPWFRVDLPSPQVVGRVAIRGNREYLNGYDFIRARIEVLGAGGATLWMGSFDLPQPDRDLDIVLPAPIAGASSVKFTSEADESNEPGFADLEVFGP